MRDVEKRDAVLDEYGARKGWTDSAIGACKGMADEIVRLRDENAALKAAVEWVLALHVRAVSEHMEEE